MQAEFERLGPPPFDAADKDFAEKIRATLSAEDIAYPYRRHGVPFREDQPLADFITKLGQTGVPMLGSTDVGDVSWKVPLVQADGATVAVGTPFHSWQMTAQGKSPLAKKGMVHVAKVMAATAAEAIRNPELLAAAKAEHAARLASSPYECPIPAGVKPNLQPRPKGV